MNKKDRFIVYDTCKQIIKRQEENSLNREALNRILFELLRELIENNERLFNTILVNLKSETDMFAGQKFLESIGVHLDE